MRISDWSSDVCSSDLLTFDDVRKAKPIPNFESLQPPKALFQRQDGLKVAISLERSDEGTWVELRAMPGEAQAAGQQEKNKQVTEEASRLNARFEGWAYRIPTHRSETLQTTPSDVIEQR